LYIDVPLLCYNQSTEDGMKNLTEDLRVERLERKVKGLRTLCLLQLCLLVAFALWSFAGSRVRAQNSPDVLRTRGLVIEDSRGHARILLGAPFPRVQERKRQDATKEAIVFLDENGKDRLILGEGPDPNVNGKISPRVAQSFGMFIHDTKGNERGGFSWLDNGRAAISLDRPDQDAWAAVVDDKSGLAYMVTYYAPDVAGRNTTGIITGTQGSTAFFHLKDMKDVDRAVLQVAGDGQPSFQIFDSGRPARDLLRPEFSK
jgi:hypothetical protein